MADCRRPRRHPDVIFLSEAFTRPKVMQRLAKLRFNQSCVCSPWRNTAQELSEYLTELTRTETQEYLRPNFFTNHPTSFTGSAARRRRRCRSPPDSCRDAGGKLRHLQRLRALRERCRQPGLGGVLHSEKYEIRPRSWINRALSTARARVNRIRREHRALQFNGTLAFHEVDNRAFLWFSKTPPSNGVDQFDPAGPTGMRRCLSSRTPILTACSTARACRSWNSAWTPASHPSSKICSTRRVTPGRANGTM